VLQFGFGRSYDDRLLGGCLTGSSPTVAAVLIWVLEVVALGYLAVCAPHSPAAGTRRIGAGEAAECAVCGNRRAC
jgi:hypothetical protein